ncbi:hypothetical protein BBO99_00009590 [Phytophthora kernoviae]|uniref:RxLR effector protein n=1 Tax=Phytophthora kernoviae TaxID=325452 RepID=A0A3R7GSE2_9STRA|nr:hypothetical protein BBI17_009635 [Phytophthora kernoviae]RLN73025.1 hypothetical protein BBO99_00009590 [Phytophthora kernoviae]
MRVCYILLMAAATLFANSNAASAVTTVDQKKLTNVVSGDIVQLTNEQVGRNGKRFLRSHKVDDDDDDEERKGPWLFSSDKITKLMKPGETYLFQKIRSWKKKKYTDALEWLFHLLSLNPHMEHKLCQERLEHLPKLGSNKNYIPTIQDVQGIWYLEVTINEALRLV